MDTSYLREFWELVVTVWREGLFGIDVAHMLLALFIILVSIALRTLFTRYVLSVMKRLALRAKLPVNSTILDALYDPLRFVPVLFGIFVATNVLNLEDSTTEFFYNINRSLVSFTLFWAFFRLSEPVGNLAMHNTGALTDAMINWIIRIAKIAFVVLGGATILELWGIAVGPIIAGLGLFGVAVALGAQDLFKNLIAGLFVLG